MHTELRLVGARAPRNALTTENTVQVTAVLVVHVEIQGITDARDRMVRAHQNGLPAAGLPEGGKIADVGFGHHRLGDVERLVGTGTVLYFIIHRRTRIGYRDGWRTEGHTIGHQPQHCEEQADLFHR